MTQSEQLLIENTPALVVLIHQSAAPW